MIIVDISQSDVGDAMFRVIDKPSLEVGNTIITMNRAPLAIPIQYLWNAISICIGDIQCANVKAGWNFPCGRFNIGIKNGNFIQTGGSNDFSLTIAVSIAQ